MLLLALCTVAVNALIHIYFANVDRLYKCRIWSWLVCSIVVKFPLDLAVVSMVTVRLGQGQFELE